MTKRYDTKRFTCGVNGEEVRFTAYTTDTRNGFCHTIVCESHNITNTKVGYINRTWERFTYETALRNAIAKLPKHLREGAKAVLIDHKAEEEYNKANAQVEAFKALHEGLSDENKRRLADSGIVMQSEADVQGVMGLMALMSIMQE